MTNFLKEFLKKKYKKNKAEKIEIIKSWKLSTNLIPLKYCKLNQERIWKLDRRQKIISKIYYNLFMKKICLKK